jgi:recombination protein RecT
LVAQQQMVKSLFGDKAKANKFLATAVKVASDFKLANCNTQSIIDACITVAQMNLDLSPALSHAYIVPFGQKVQLIVSARGYTALLARTGWKIKSYIVNTEDEFDYIIDGFDESIKFKKNIDSESETFRYAVALAQSPDGTLYVEIMNWKQIDKHRKVSSNQKGATPSGVWKDWFNEMALKTVIKKLVKKLPMGEDIALVVEKDDKPIEGEIVEQKPELKEDEVDLNSLNMMGASEEKTQEVAPTQNPIEIEVQPTAKTPAQKMKEKLVEKGVTEIKAEDWCMRNESAIQLHLDEPTLINTVAEQLVDF